MKTVYQCSTSNKIISCVSNYSFIINFLRHNALRPLLVASLVIVQRSKITDVTLISITVNSAPACNYIQIAKK